MLIKPKVMPADPTTVCKTCGHYDPTLQICCARDMLITKADAEQWTCGDWEKKKINVFTTAENIIGMTPANPVEVPLQPDGSLKMQAKETIGAETVNTDAVVRLQTLCDEAEPCKAKLTFQYQKKQEEQLPPGACCFNCEHRDKMSLKCKLKLSDAVLTVERSQHEYCGSWEREQDHGVTLRVVDPEEDKKKSVGWDHRLEAKALDRGAKQGMTQEALDTVFAIACQQVPSMEQRWMELKGQINVMFAQKWAAEDMPE